MSTVKGTHLLCSEARSDIFRFYFVPAALSCDLNGPDSCTVNVKWGKELFKDVEVNPNEPPTAFKATLFSLTNVPVDRQKGSSRSNGIFSYHIIRQNLSKNFIHAFGNVGFLNVSVWTHVASTFRSLTKIFLLQ
jgi:hypothetical protein